jgi:hypothetical protein
MERLIAPPIKSCLEDGAGLAVARQSLAVDTDRRDETLRLTLNPQRSAAWRLDGWTGWTSAGRCCAPPPSRPGLGPGSSAASSWGFGPTVTIDP